MDLFEFSFFNPRKNLKRQNIYRNDREQRRIDAIKKCVYQFKISVNQEEIATSDVFHMDQDFTADEIQQAFHLWIRDNPQNISIQLFHKIRQSQKKWILLAVVNVPIPSA